MMNNKAYIEAQRAHEQAIADVGKTKSTSEQGIFETETLERRIRFVARCLSLDLTGAIADITQEVTGSRAPLFLIGGEALQTVYDRLRARVHVGDFVPTGEASFDRIRRADDDTLRLVAFLADLEDKPYENMAAAACRDELERRGVRE